MAEVSLPREIKTELINFEKQHFIKPETLQMPNSDIRKILFVGNYLPRKCGIATFTYDMRHSLARIFPDAECGVVPVNDRMNAYDYPAEVQFEIHEADLESYWLAADFINSSSTDIVCLQHEYGIFGGSCGSHVLALMNELRVPVVTTLHTVLKEPSPDQLRVLKAVCRLSSRVVVMTKRARAFLNEIYEVPASKIDIIAHGIPDVPFEKTDLYKARFQLSGKLVALTFGLLSPNKGIEHVLQSMPEIISHFPDFTYVVLGATHPGLVQAQGEQYRQSLERMAHDLGISKNVRFFDRFVDLAELTDFILAADIYVTPYLNQAQITSGTLAYSFGCGKPIVSTPYWHAEELLAEGRGMIVPFADPAALAEAITILCKDEPMRSQMARNAYQIGREMIWENSAKQYQKVFQQVCDEKAPRPVIRSVAGSQAGLKLELPGWRFDHLRRMTDKNGLIQHASHSVPNMAEGYCTDDNARALILTVHLEELGCLSTGLERMANRYAAFIDSAYNPDTKRFRNFLGQDCRWLEATGSEDSQGRTVWALGACAGRSKRSKLRSWAELNFPKAAAPLRATISPRAWAFGLLGLNSYLLRVGEDHQAVSIRDELAGRLVDLYQRSATDDWPWFEEILSYDLGRVPHALIATGFHSENRDTLEIGLHALRWLIKVQKAPRQYFQPVGCYGFYPKGAEKARFDQQPIEANSMVSACMEAYRATRDSFWLKEAQSAFAWFLGRNDLGLELYDSTSGGCFDGLQEDRVNRNQGAESTLAFLHSLAEMNQFVRLQSASVRQFHDFVPVSSGR